MFEYCHYSNLIYAHTIFSVRYAAEKLLRVLVNYAMGLLAIV